MEVKMAKKQTKKACKFNFHDLLKENAYISNKYQNCEL
ncbi:hypothetical protein SAMD00020551_2905 [Mesobacillus selenatarsenatis SF-1]|uniref:Uncharacterized protein n=1 Tax=Mesobacillus selenatarsenatis (strain DSM 18680 / JCM 14380 / FERM P-15431 / SF-1) TaxID=1321606 RepID=A0A0A8X9C2_MESS1|nr:hypothetical protein SAMD00020551_2905 [Mesobacillus selenatarsenatis SF-1]